MTIDQLAPMVGYERSTLNNIELEIKPSMPKARLERLATALTVDPAVLLREPVGQETRTAGAA